MFFKNINDMENIHDLLGKKQDPKFWDQTDLKIIMYTCISELYSYLQPRSTGTSVKTSADFFF